MAIERSTMLGAIPDLQIASSSFYNEPDKTGRAWFYEFYTKLDEKERAWFVTLKPYELDQFFAECDKKFKEPQRIELSETFDGSVPKLEEHPTELPEIIRSTTSTIDGLEARHDSAIYKFRESIRENKYVQLD